MCFGIVTGQNQPNTIQKILTGNTTLKIQTPSRFKRKLKKKYE